MPDHDIRSLHGFRGDCGMGMRIAYIITRSDDLGGAQVHVRDLAGALAELGHRPVVLAGAEGLMADQVRDRGVRFVGLRHLGRAVHPIRDARALAEIRARLREIGPDLISTHCSKAGLLGRLAGASLRIPTVFTAHGWRFPLYDDAFKRGVTRLAERIASPLSTRIITVCESDRELAIRKGIAPPGRLVTIHNAMPDIDPALAADPGSSRRPVRLLMVARLVIQKDHTTLLHALSELRDLEWRLDFVGSGPREQEIRELCDALGLSARVSFLGFRDDVPRLLADADAFVLCSHWEGFPRSILEAMRAGLPVVASNVGGVREAVLDGQTGFLVPEGAPGVLGERLRRLIGTPSLRARMGRAGRELFLERFSFSSLVRSTVSLYEQLLGENGRSEALAYRSRDRAAV